MAHSKISQGSVSIAREQDLVEQANCLFASRWAEPEEDILEILRSLEEINEESFPYFTLVRWLRSSIENHLDDFVTSEYNISTNEDISPAAWNEAARDVYNSIMEYPQVVNLLDSIRDGHDSTESLVQDLLQLNITPSRRVSRLSMCESDSSMDDTWWMQSVLPQQYQQLAEDICARKATQSRIEALKLILSSHVSDAAEGPHWKQLRRGLREALCDENEAIFMLGLKIHAKLLTSSVVHIAIKEAFVNLVESVSTHFMSRKMLPNLPTYETGIDFAKPFHFRIIKILQLISDSQREIPKEWIRFSTRKVEEMIESFVDMLSMHTYDGISREKYLYPFHLLSIIDCNASWSLHWCHGIYSRNLLLRALSRSSPLLRFSSEFFLKWMEDFDPIQYLNLKSSLQSIKNNAKSFKAPGCVVQYTVFCCCIHMLQTVLSYDGGRLLFPVSNPECATKLSINALATASVDFLNNHSEEIGQGGPATKLVNFISSIIKIPKISIETPLVLAILQPVLEAHSDQSQETTYPLQNHTVSLIQVLVSSDDGIRSLMGGRRPRGSFRHRSSSENLSCLARTLAEYMAAVFKNHRHADAKLLDSLLSICSKLQLSHDFFLYLDSTGLFHTLNHFYKFLKSRIEHEMLSSFTKMHYSYCSLLQRLIQCYIQILRTPKGIFCVERDGILYDVMQDLFENNLICWQRPLDLILISQVINYPSGARAVREERVMAEQLTQVWQQLDVESNAVNILSSVCNSLTSVQMQLSERTGSEETLLALCGPCNLAELLEATALGTEQEEVLSTSTVHHTGLSLLQNMVADPDIALVLQHRFALQDNLLKLQKENCSSSEDTVVIDELSLLRNHILIQLALVGGPGERLVPPATMPQTGDFPWPLFSSLPVPKDYVKTGSRGISKRQGELLKFLSDTRPGVHDAQWLVHCRRAAKTTLSQTSEEIKGPVLLDLIKQVLRASPNASFVLGNINLEQLHPEESHGITIALRYGSQLRLVQAVPQTHENLSCLLRFSRTLKPMKSEHFGGFDWLVASVFLVLCGNIEKCQSFLQSLASLKWAPLIWPALADRCKTRHKLEATLAHLLELILQSEEPQLILAFQKSGISIGNIMCNWIRCCFWNILDWSGVTQWFLLALLAEPDTTLYLTVAMLRHIKARILYATSSETLTRLTIGPLDKFSIGDALPVIEKLSKRHRHKILPHLQAALSA